MSLIVIALGFLFISVFAEENNQPSSIASKSLRKIGKAHIQPWAELKDSETNEESLATNIIGKPSERKRRSVQVDDLEAQEDDSTKYKSVEEVDKNARPKRNQKSWRTPRNYQFVTRTSRQDRDHNAVRSGRLIESGGRFYEDRNSFRNYNRNAQDYRGRSNFQNKRVIYYAVLPEPTRRPEYERYLRDYDRDLRDRDFDGQYNLDKYNNFDRYYSTQSYNQNSDKYNNYYERYEPDLNRQYEVNYQRPETKYQRPETDYRPDTNYQRPEISYQRPETDYQRPETNYQRPETNYQRPETNYQRPESNYQRPESNYQRPNYPGYPSDRDNEITRVSSSIIDVTTKDEKTERIRDDPGLSKYLIIDREPPYLTDVYNFLSSFKPNAEKYSEFLSQYTKEDVTERNTKKPPRKQMSVPLPPVELTVFKGKPLDIRPLDLAVETSSNTGNKDRPTSTHKPTTLNPIQEFERTYKYK